MPRRPLSDEDQRRGKALGSEIKRLRGANAASTLASSSAINLDTWRRIEQGKVANPGFFLVADIAAALNVPMEDLAAATRRRADVGAHR